MNYYKIPLAFIALGSMIACGKTTDDIKNTIEASSIMGNWKGTCNGSGILDRSYQEFYGFDGANFTLAQEYYKNSDCSEPIAQLVYSGTLELDGENDVKAERINLTYEKASLTVMTEDGASLLDTLNFCGVDQWEAGKTVDLSSQSADTLCPVTDMGTKTFDIAKEVDHQLFFGKSDGDKDKSASEKRPSDLDRENPFVETDREFDSGM